MGDFLLTGDLLNVDAVGECNLTSILIVEIL
jgi:hypothetical protein